MRSLLVLRRNREKSCGQQLFALFFLQVYFIIPYRILDGLPPSQLKLLFVCNIIGKIKIDKGLIGDTGQILLVGKYPKPS